MNQDKARAPPYWIATRAGDVSILHSEHPVLGRSITDGETFPTDHGGGNRSRGQGEGFMRKLLTFCATILTLLFSVQASAQEISRLSAQFLRFDRTETASAVAACGPGVVRTGCPAVPTPGSGGRRVYSKSVFVPNTSGTPVLYVTISAVGDNHGGESNYLSCNVDGPGGVGNAATVCNPENPSGAAVDGAPPGWVTLTHHFAYETKYGSNGKTGQSAGDGGGGTSDEHDNDYYYTWCKPVRPGTHIINLRLGNFSGGTTTVPTGTLVFFEKAFVYIDASGNPPFGACNKAVIPTS